MSYVYCCVPGCTSWKKTNPEIKFHRFPPVNHSKVFDDDAHGKTLTDRRELWITRLKIAKEVKKYMTVCSLHFKEDDFFQGAKKIRFLKPAAVPSINLPTMTTGPVPPRRGIYNFSSMVMEIVLGQCSKCSFQYQWNFQLDRHVQRRHCNVDATKLFHAIVEPEQFSCVFCVFTTFFVSDLYEHYKQRLHGRIPDEDNMEQSLFCDEQVDNRYLCNCSYKSNSSLCLVKHSCKTAVKPSTANSSESESDTPALNLNVIDHSKITEQIQCIECPYDTRCKCILKRNTPSEKAMVRCGKCSYKAKFYSTLKCHMLRHASDEEIRWFQCRKCSYRAKLKGNLKRHVFLKHTPEEKIYWFHCAKCPFRAKRKTEIKSHVLLKHNYYYYEEKVQLFQCTKCVFVTKQKSNLNRHMLTHNRTEDMAWFQCANCQYRTEHKNRLKKHIMLQHACSEVVNCFQWLPSVGSIKVGSNIVVGSKKDVRSSDHTDHDHTYSLMI